MNGRLASIYTTNKRHLKHIQWLEKALATVEQELVDLADLRLFLEDGISLPGNLALNSSKESLNGYSASPPLHVCKEFPSSVPSQPLTGQQGNSLQTRRVRQNTTNKDPDDEEYIRCACSVFSPLQNSADISYRH